MTAAIESGTSSRKQGSRAKNVDVKTNSVAPSDWVTTLLHAKADGSSVLLEFRSGRNGQPMLAESIPYQTLDGTPHESVIPLAVECWETAKIHRGELSGARYDYRIRVVSTEEDGSFTAQHESSWVELAEGDTDVMVLPAGMDSRNWTEQMLSGMVLKLFTANIQLTRASGALVREMSAGTKERFEAEFFAVNKVKEMAMELVERERELAAEEADAKEVEEMGHTARHWMTLGNESKLAKEGVQIPDVPKTRADAAKGLWQSINMAQLEKLTKELGDKADLLLGLIQNAATMDDDQIADVFAEHIPQDMKSKMEFQAIIDRVFCSKFVPGPYAIWQQRTLSVLLEGPPN